MDGHHGPRSVQNPAYRPTHCRHPSDQDFRADSPPLVRDRSARVLGGVATAAVLASLVDVVTTWVALDSGARELNPITRTAMDVLGAAGALLVGLAMRVAIVGALVALSRLRGPRGARWAAAGMLVAVATWWVVIDVNNVGMLSR
jgi:hypothetical protein